jgi:TonB family protein
MHADRPDRPRRRKMLIPLLAFGAAAVSLGGVATLTTAQLLDRASHRGHRHHVHRQHVHRHQVDRGHRERVVVAPRARAVRPGPALVPVGAEPYFEFQVERPVVPAARNVGPRYPEILRDAHVEGEVLAQFVVDHHGRVDMSTFRVLKSSHRLFTGAVREAVVGAQYVPAELHGARVPQLVQQPFVFQLSR